MLLGWIALNIYFFVDTFLSYSDPKYFYTKKILGNALAVARASAAALNFNCMLVLLPVCRHSLETIRALFTKLRFRSLHNVTDEAIHFHRYVAYMIIFWTLIHYYSHCYNVDRFTLAYISPEELNVASFSNSSYQNDKLDHYFAYSLTQHFSRTDNPENYLNPLKAENLPVLNTYRIRAGWSGAIITVALFSIFASSLEHIRRRYFEVGWCFRK